MVLKNDNRFLLKIPHRVYNKSKMQMQQKKKKNQHLLLSLSFAPKVIQTGTSCSYGHPHRAHVWHTEWRAETIYTLHLPKLPWSQWQSYGFVCQHFQMPLSSDGNWQDFRGFMSASVFFYTRVRSKIRLSDRTSLFIIHRMLSLETHKEPPKCVERSLLPFCV